MVPLDPVAVRIRCEIHAVAAVCRQDIAGNGIARTPREKDAFLVVQPRRVPDERIVRASLIGNAGAGGAFQDVLANRIPRTRQDTDSLRIIRTSARRYEDRLRAAEEQ